MAAPIGACGAHEPEGDARSGAALQGCMRPIADTTMVRSAAHIVPDSARLQKNVGAAGFAI